MRLGIKVLNVMKSEEIVEKVFKFDNFCDTLCDVSNHADYVHLGDLDIFDNDSNYLSEHPRVYIPTTIVKADIGCYNFNNPIEKLLISENAFLLNESNFYVNNANRIQIPSTITKIPKCCFSRSKLEELVVPPNVREIGTEAFSDSTSLTSLYIPKSVTKIGKRVVAGCTNLNSIVFEDGRTFDIGKETEDQENIHNVTPNTTKLNYNVEFPLNSTRIEVPSSVTKICCRFFSKYKNLCEIVFPTTIKKFESLILDECNKLTKISFCSCLNKSDNTNVHDIEQFKKFFFDTVAVSYEFYLQMKAFGYTFHNVNYIIHDYNLYGTKVDFSVIKYIYNQDKNVILNNTNSLKSYILTDFNYNDKFVIPSKIEVLDRCFCNSDYFKDVDVSLVTKKITGECFSGAQFLQSVTFSNTLEKICYEVFNNCYSLKSVTLPKSLKKVGERCFAFCYSLESVCCESQEVVYNSQCFMNCFNLKTIPKIQFLKRGIFWCCNSLVKFESFGDVECIPHCTFMKCYNLKEIILPENLKTIEKFAFKNCYSLENLTFPKTLVIMEDGCFMNCSNLQSVNFKNKNIKFGNDVFEGCTSLTEIQIEGEKINNYNGEVSYTLHKQFEKNSIFCDNVKVKFNDLKIFGIDILKNKNVHRIDEGAFFNNTTITEIEIPNNITQIGNFCFACATQLENVILPSSITELTPFCFDNCVSLNTINLEHIKNIGMGCFDNTKFEKVVVLQTKTN
ncbi:hypothetical protein EIN_305530 [Entamoeba invadens IP1]|uniref:Leucine rich repeat containing protein BspA family protein n=1 Tax=Entamoeba invadens IP1 TaxID=370355 RepID=A0A0A1TYR9_ENTIV|nr:hypothetical protein EIN_305530 [Entamoeba invadens IP1]ELP86697.1 hypothetical protein EIN_305530 [Entamoeba invadens IP1]|eukprot:XP_004186043.1 hypothetical protein EIN_305530 [Entamoeba invadens IP1]